VTDRQTHKYKKKIVQQLSKTVQNMSYTLEFGYPGLLYTSTFTVIFTPRALRS